MSGLAIGIAGKGLKWRIAGSLRRGGETPALAKLFIY